MLTTCVASCKSPSKTLSRYHFCLLRGRHFDVCYLLVLFLVPQQIFLNFSTSRWSKRDISRGAVRKAVGEGGRQELDDWIMLAALVLIICCRITKDPKLSGTKTIAVLPCCPVCGRVHWGRLVSAPWGPGTQLQWLGQHEFTGYVTRALALAAVGRGVSLLFLMLCLPGMSGAWAAWVSLSAHSLSVWLTWDSMLHSSHRVVGLVHDVLPKELGEACTASVPASTFADTTSATFCLSGKSPRPSPDD